MYRKRVLWTIIHLSDTPARYTVMHTQAYYTIIFTPDWYTIIFLHQTGTQSFSHRWFYRNARICRNVLFVINVGHRNMETHFIRHTHMILVYIIMLCIITLKRYIHVYQKCARHILFIEFSYVC